MCRPCGLPEPQKPVNWRSRPIFISGTFRDMHAERDLVAGPVFRKLEEELAKYYTTLEAVDLRVGVETRSLADDHAKQALVLKVCLDDVKRCRPFLIVLIGDRYGWVPPIERAKAAAQEAGFERTVDGKSVTALEIEHGLWEAPDQQTRSRIYFRQLDYTGMAEVDAILYSDERAALSHMVTPEERTDFADRAAKLRDLKDALRKDPLLRSRCRDYHARWDPTTKRVSGLEAFVTAVVDDLLPDMVAEAKEQVAAAKAGLLPTPLEQFVAERARGFTGRTDIVVSLCDFAAGSGASGWTWPDTLRGRIVTGSSGAGKSAIFARVHEEMSAADGSSEQFWLLSHAAGIDPRSSSILTLLHGWVVTLARKLGVENPLAVPGDAGDGFSRLSAQADMRPEPDEAFADLLSRAAARARVVLLIDALDRFERTPQAEHLTWLPPRLPANVRLLATAISGVETQALAQRPDMVVESLMGLTTDEAMAIAKTVYARYHRTPNADAVHELVEKAGPDSEPPHGNALWLVSALEELNLLDGDDFRRADAEAQATEEDRLHAMVVSEGRAMPGDVEALYARIFERAGRRVSDDAEDGAALARAFAVTIALSRGGFRERDLSELIPKVARLLDPGRDDRSTTTLSWNALAFASLRRALRAHLVRRGEEDRWDFHHRQARPAAERAYAPNANVRRQIHECVAEHLQNLSPDDPLRESETMYHLIEADAREKAARLYAGDLTPGGLEGCRDSLVARALEDEGGTWVRGLLEIGALETDVIGSLASRYMFDMDPALAHRPRLDLRLGILSAVEGALNRLISAGSCIAHAENALGACYITLGDILAAKGNLPEAHAAFQASRATRERLASADPGDSDCLRGLAVSHERLGTVLSAQGDLAAALASFQASLAIRQLLVASDTGNGNWQRDLSVVHNWLGDVLTAQGDLRAGLEMVRSGLAIRERLAATNPSSIHRQRDLSVSWNKLGVVLVAQGDLPAARAAFQDGLAIAKVIAAADPERASWQHDLSVSHSLLGDVLQRQGDLPEALTAFQASLALMERLAAADRSNAGWQHSLATMHCRVGVVLGHQGNAIDALRNLLVGLGIQQRLVAADPTNAAWQRAFYVSNWKLGALLLLEHSPEARHYLHAARRVLDSMLANGIPLSPSDLEAAEALDVILRSPP